MFIFLFLTDYPDVPLEKFSRLSGRRRRHLYFCVCQYTAHHPISYRVSLTTHDLGSSAEFRCLVVVCRWPSGSLGYVLGNNMYNEKQNV